MRFISNLFKIILDCTSSWLETFDLEKFISRHPSITKIYGYIFPERVEIKEEPVKSIDYHISKKDNLIHVSFNYTRNQKYSINKSLHRK